MKVICPFCLAKQPISWKQADSGEPIICKSCGRNMRQEVTQSEMKGEKK